jgi:lambda family phage portal protein
MLTRIVSALFGPSKSAPVRGLSARYDAAQTTDDNRRHWANADFLAATSANSPYVRQTLRVRSRYEHENNSYMRGAVSTLVSDTVGSGPRLQVLTSDDGLNTAVETAWQAWAEAVNLADVLRVLDTSKRVDGEGFLALGTNRRLLDSQPVALGVQCLEADQVAEPFGGVARPDGDDGVRVDKAGNVTQYSVLDRHPGDLRAGVPHWQAKWVDAGQLLHWHRPTRPGQLRGVPEFTPSLPLFSQLRRFTLATLTAAETAAMIAGILQTQQGVGVAEFKAEKEFDRIEFARGMLMTVPAGYDIKQLQAEQPTTLYEMFVNCLLREIGRVLDMPFGLIAGDCSGYNFSSARLDLQSYDLRRQAEKQQLAARVLNPLFRAWLAEAVIAYRPDRAWSRLGDPYQVPLSWHFDSRGAINPVDEADAAVTELEHNLTTLAELCARRGRDWQQVLRQRAKEKAEIERLGLTPTEAKQAASGTPPSRPRQSRPEAARAD